MNGVTRFWRVYYDSERALTGMLTHGTLVAPTSRLIGGRNDCSQIVASKMKLGDGLVLARFDLDRGIARVVAIGILQNQSPGTLVNWRSAQFELAPNPQGGVAQWKKEVCFKFDNKVATRYRLAERFAAVFG